MNDLEWDLEIEYDAKDQIEYLNTHVPVDGTDYRLYVIAEEEPQYLAMTFYNPLFIPEDRTIEALRFIDQINQRQRVGRMAIVSNHLQYRALIDVEGCEPGIEVLKNLYRNGYHAMKFWMPRLGKLIFAAKSSLPKNQRHGNRLGANEETLQRSPPSSLQFKLARCFRRVATDRQSQLRYRFGVGRRRASPT